MKQTFDDFLDDYLLEAQYEADIKAEYEKAKEELLEKQYNPNHVRYLITTQFQG